jgi:putative membrane protein
MSANIVLEKKMNVAAYVISVAVLLLVGLMRQIKLNVGIDFSFLPPLHASLNALTAVLLVIALYFIKNGNIQAHRNAIYAALVCSALFLVSYVLYHFTTPETIFGDTNGDHLLSAEEKAAVSGTRPFYLVLLLSHIVLAAVTLPFILLTFNRAFTGQYARHKKMARWVFPLWLYVAVTGPICYWLLKPYY